MNILVLNSGSSSQKSALFDLHEVGSCEPQSCLWEAKIEWNSDSADLRVRSAKSKLHQSVTVGDREGAIEHMLGTLWGDETGVLTGPEEIDVVGHRIVHGGHKLDDAILVTPEVKSVIASVAAFAPLHNRAELEGIEIVERLVGCVPQVAVFDTGFHRTIPRAAALYPGPYHWFLQGIRRYGFHGINHQYCSQRAAQLLKRDIYSMCMVSCHLGNGCSLAAIRGGQSVDTTMGLTPLEGLMMGTRSGSVDPGVLTYFLRQSTITGQELDETLNKKSGLLGISGVSSDVRDILAAIAQGNDRAKLAFDMFVHRLTSGIGAMAAVLGGIDALVFTGGIGENSTEVRAGACANLEFLGVKLDAGKNSQSPADEEISSPDSHVRVLIIRAQEDWAIAQACVAILKNSHHKLVSKRG